jgi:DNA-binding IclR family transcriptional regulator
MRTQEMSGHGIQSLELGLNILNKIAEQNKSLTITEIATLCEMSKSKLHRYLTSFCRFGLLQRNGELRYSLGTGLILLGLQASSRIDVKEIAIPFLLNLRENLNETIALAIWGGAGPFYICWEESQRAVNIGIKVGTKVSLIHSATGKVFAAFSTKEQIEPLIQQELKDADVDLSKWRAEIEDVKANGFSIVKEGVVPGVATISCPVFDQNGNITAAITVVGLLGLLDISERSNVIQTLLENGRTLSKALGHH